MTRVLGFLCKYYKVNYFLLHSSCVLQYMWHTKTATNYTCSVYLLSIKENTPTKCLLLYIYSTLKELQTTHNILSIQNMSHCLPISTDIMNLLRMSPWPIWTPTQQHSIISQNTWNPGIMNQFTHQFSKYSVH